MPIRWIHIRPVQVEQTRPEYFSVVVSAGQDRRFVLQAVSGAI